jgi:hypothetical protein
LELWEDVGVNRVEMTTADAWFAAVAMAGKVGSGAPGGPENPESKFVEYWQVWKSIVDYHHHRYHTLFPSVFEPGFDHVRHLLNVMKEDIRSCFGPDYHHGRHLCCYHHKWYYQSRYEPGRGGVQPW